MTNKLKKLALAANVIDHNESSEWYDEEGLLGSRVSYPKNARYIAAASPGAILALIAERDALQLALDKVSSWTGGGVEVSLEAWRKAEKDAARYRWLRDKGDATWVPLKTRWLDSYYTEQAEAHIDAAIAALAASNGGV